MATSTSNVGLVEKTLKRGYPAAPEVTAKKISVSTVNLSIRAAGLVVGPHSWTSPDQLHLQITFMKERYVPGAIERIQTDMAQLISRLGGGDGQFETVAGVV